MCCHINTYYLNGGYKLSIASRKKVAEALYKQSGIPTARFTGQECLEQPDRVVEEFLNLFSIQPR